jgi:hypothetical protein
MMAEIRVEAPEIREKGYIWDLEMAKPQDMGS